MPMDELHHILARLLGREVISPNHQLLKASSQGKSILVTGAGGSIGSELCRQLILQQPAAIVLIERSEIALYAIENELREFSALHDRAGCINIVPILGSIRDQELVEKTISRYSVSTIYHAAAYKQVPMLERHVVSGIQNNILGTQLLVHAAEKFAVENFILISTDKAVRPVNVMGATKRFAEQILQARNALGSHTRFSVVRFGNVLGSSGSVIPLFMKQILRGGPVTVTHPEMTRFFMTVEEAAQLVIQAGALARGGEVFVLDMNKPIRIADMARQLIRLMGYEVCECRQPSACHCKNGVAIQYTGLREGEKLIEELYIGSNIAGTAHPKITRSIEAFLDWPILQDALDKLKLASKAMDHYRIRALLAETVEGFSGRPTLLEEKEEAMPALSETLATGLRKDPRLTVVHH